ncbi:hypothetical protein [Kitasatospora sp. NPDC093558]|uniref:hypothetical protein n=1 Tax=Kitasatospora sp. NPDC093558 TaxID=3155201 RepID=UPI00341B02BC
MQCRPERGGAALVELPTSPLQPPDVHEVDRLVHTDEPDPRPLADPSAPGGVLGGLDRAPREHPLGPAWPDQDQPARVRPFRPHSAYGPQPPVRVHARDGDGRDDGRRPPLPSGQADRRRDWHRADDHPDPDPPRHRPVPPVHPHHLPELRIQPASLPPSAPPLPSTPRALLEPAGPRIGPRPPEWRPSVTRSFTRDRTRHRHPGHLAPRAYGNRNPGRRILSVIRPPDPAPGPIDAPWP